MVQYDRKKLGQLLKEMRKKAQLSQGEVSRHLKHSGPQFISKIERGTSPIPLDTLGRMLNLYKAKPDEAAEIILNSQQELLRAKLRLVG